MLTADLAREIFSYDTDAGEIRWAKKHGRKVVVGNLAGCLNSYGYRQIRVSGRKYLAHRIAWLIAYGEWPEHEVDHINGVRHDNRLANLRAATPAENRQNCALRRDNTSGYAGVIREKRCNKWMAVIRVDGKARTVGYFDTTEEAAAAYAAAKAELHTFQPVARAA